MIQIENIIFEDQDENELEFTVTFEFYEEEREMFHYCPAHYNIISIEIDGVEITPEEERKYEKHLKKRKEIKNTQDLNEWIENELTNRL